ncbi:hypothetical protein ACQPZ2_23280 [Nocardia pseudovaccinii]|uniref:hypothetical protein n=1 Tax=Nocardia pseudovaccinii TaxID=189540 RepID=UPI003D8EF2BB
MTAADRLRAEGREEGRAEGEARGEARGRATALIEQLTLKFGRLPDSVEQAIRDGGLEQLKVWAARVLTASSLDDVLAREGAARGRERRPINSGPKPRRSS